LGVVSWGFIVALGYATMCQLQRVILIICIHSQNGLQVATSQSYRMKFWKLIMIGVVWVIIWDILHLLLEPALALSLSVLLTCGLAIFLAHRVPWRKIWPVILFNFIIILFLSIESPGFLYYPLVLVICFLLIFSIAQKVKRLTILAPITLIFTAFFYWIVPHYYDWLQSINLLNMEVRIINYDYNDYENSEPLTSEDGTPRILTFWNLGCGACLQEIDMLSKLSLDESIKKDFEILCVYEHDTTRREKSMAYFDKYRTIFQATGNLRFALDSTHKNTIKEDGFPQLYIFNGSGERVHQEVGYSKSMEAFKLKKFRRILEEM
jgi:thiol-disulfide isomerase/thioredoxin